MVVATTREQRLAAVLDGVAHDLRGDDSVAIGGVTSNSRAVQPGDLFVAIIGFTRDGHEFLNDAISRGAAALCVQADRAARVPAAWSGPLVTVPDTRWALGDLAANFHGHPARRMRCIGVTGTNGKTTVTHLIAEVVAALGGTPGVLGTLGMRVGDEQLPGDRTTPEATEVQATLADMLARGATDVAMEVTSHGLALGRVVGCEYAGAVFTNLSRDHLDFHADLDAYLNAKLRLFEESRYGATDQRLNAVCIDDDAGRTVAQRARGRVVTYGLTPDAMAHAREVKCDASGSRFTLVTPGGEWPVTLRLLGEWNVANALAVCALAHGWEWPMEQVVAALAQAAPVPGRMEPVPGRGRYAVLVDYSHTPASLEQALRTCRALARGRVLVVVGCGGDRDRGKRPLMGQAAAEGADRVFITSDNPRSEEPGDIIEAIVAGVPAAARPKCRIDADRRAAIFAAVFEARAGDVVLIAGKGHETYQEVNGVKHPFDDRLVAAEARKQRRG